MKKGIEQKAKQKLNDFTKNTEYSITRIVDELRRDNKLVTAPTIYGWINGQKTISLRVWSMIDEFINTHK